MERLSSGAEQLLQEILDHRLENGSCDLYYWEQKFVLLEVDFAQDELIRSQFATLEDRKMIAVLWGDDIPCDLVVLDAGMAYCEKYMQKKHQELGMHDVKVFVSYNRESGSDFADALENKLDGKAQIIRDKKNIRAWGSISAFMKSIRDQDFVVAVVTDGYLKSIACMYEITTMIREKDWESRIIPAVLESSIYSKKLEYVQYWIAKKAEIEEKVRTQSDLTTIQALTQDAERVSRINAEINTFLTFVLDRLNPPIYTVLDEIEKRVLLSPNVEGIPRILKKETKYAQICDSMSKTAEDLLLKAKNAQKKIVFGYDLSGYYIGLVGEEQAFASHTEDRKVAEWKEAISQLVELELIIQVDTKGRIYELTNRGYSIADEIDGDI